MLVYYLKMSKKEFPELFAEVCTFYLVFKIELKIVRYSKLDNMQRFFFNQVIVVGLRVTKGCLVKNKSVLVHTTYFRSFYYLENVYRI